MQRILHVVGKMDRGGAETLIMNVYRNIERKKIQFDFVVHGDETGIYSDEISQLGGHVYHIPKYRVINYSSYVQAWKQLFSKHPEYNIIHAHMNSTANIYLKIAKKFGLYTIEHSHNTSNGFGYVVKLKDYNSKQSIKFADKKLACSVDAGHWLYGSNDFVVYNNAIDINRFYYREDARIKLRHQLGIDESTLLLGHVGRFEEQKNHQFFLSLLPKLKRNDYHLVFIGTGTLENEIKLKIKDMNLDKNVSFLGVQTNVDEWLSAMDILIFPSLYEGLSLSLVEAQATGLPILLSDTISKENELTDLITFLPLNDIGEWVKAIQHTHTDLPKREEYNEVISLAGYSDKEVAKQWENMYLNIR